MDTVFKTLFFRHPPIHYVSPPVCENIFSSSSGPVIVLNALPRLTGISGLVQGGIGNFFIRWGSYPGAICYSVYQSTDPNDPAGTYVLIAECIPNPEFDLSPYASGYYVVTAITPEGETPFSDPVFFSMPTGCIEDVGDPCPTGPNAFDISGEVVWPEKVIDYADGIMVFGSSGLCFDTHHYTEFPDDYPPGHYDLEYLEGTVVILTEAGPDYHALAYKHYIIHSDVAFNTTDMFNNSVADHPNFSLLSYIKGPSAVSEPDAVTALETTYGGARFLQKAAVDNTYAPMRITVDDCSWSNAHADGSWTDLYPMRMRLVQVDGLIQQPRPLRIVDWSAGVVSPDIFNNWDGHFHTRDTYTSNSLAYNVAASGPFGGAVLSYSQAHPVAPNGAGFTLEIFLGAVSYWKGYKIVGNTAPGTYMRANGYFDGPLCFIVDELVI